MSYTKHALVGGGSGFIGNHLVKQLTQNGYNVTIVSRMPGLRHITWHELERNGIPKGVNAVINMAGQNVLDPSRRWTAGFKQNVWNSRINTSLALAKAITAAPQVKSFINLVGVSHYRPSEKKIYNEKDETEGFDYMSRLCLEWEKAATLSEEALKHCKQIIIRTGVVVGQNGGMIKSILMPFKMGLGGPMGNGNQIMPWIHVDDLCSLIKYAIENEKVKGILNGVAPQIVSNGEFSKTFAATLRRPCIFAIPEFVVHALFGNDRAALLLSGAKIEPKHTLEIGFEFKYPTAKSACEEVLKKSK